MGSGGYLCIEMVGVGITTEAIDALVHQFLVSQGAYPAAINFFGFPKTICASVNEGKSLRVTLPPSGLCCIVELQ